jgi:alpha-ketoglutarate-dependent taurine dioxygenase
MSIFTTKKLGASVGAEVLGVEVDQLAVDDDLPAACMEALEEHGVLVFRELHVDDETQIAFSKKLDDVGKPEPAEPPKIYLVTLDPKKNPNAEYLRGTFAWHIDGAQDDVPTKATMLSAHAIAAIGGDTEFAGTYAAYEDLTDEAKERFERLRILHSFEQLARWHEKSDKEHPLVWRHRSGRRSLVIGATASHVVGMDMAEGRALLDGLLARATAPDRVYRHEWTVGDMVIWDNTGVLHRACPYDPHSSREMHRTTMSGDEPIQ